MTGSTDNQGNAYAVQKAMSTKYPLALLLMELSEEMRGQQVVLDLRWMPRETNQEADDLSNLKTGAFDPASGSGWGRARSSSSCWTSSWRRRPGSTRSSCKSGRHGRRPGRRLLRPAGLGSVGRSSRTGSIACAAFLRDLGPRDPQPWLP